MKNKKNIELRACVMLKHMVSVFIQKGISKFEYQYFEENFQSWDGLNKQETFNECCKVLFKWTFVNVRYKESAKGITYISVELSSELIGMK